MSRSYSQTVIAAFLAATTVLAMDAAAWKRSATSDPIPGYSFTYRPTDAPIRIVPTPTDGGIRAEVPPKYAARFESWKAELLATELGREQWNRYANDRGFVLRILVSKDRNKGADTSDYEWNDEGRLVGATITLSAALEDGSPSPIYYPVLNSVSAAVTLHTIRGPIVAATRLSHEFGHVNQTAESSMALMQLQNKLIPEYNSIFMGNGMNAADKKLRDLADQMKGTPVEIWESREYWSEVNAMLYLDQRINKENFYCTVFKKIRKNVETHAVAYKDRFAQHAEYNQSPCYR